MLVLITSNAWKIARPNNTAMPPCALNTNATVSATAVITSRRVAELTAIFFFSG
jgi:hypothetical protein